MRTVNWVGTLFAAEVLLQRFAVPGTQVALLLPILYAWLALAWRARVVEVDGRRLALWAAGTAASGTALVLQTAFLPNPLISPDSWLLLMAVWLPAIARFRDRRLSTYILSLRRVVAVLTVLAGGCILMMASQLAGIGYRDHLARAVPGPLLLEGFVTTYPISFGSAIFRANAWIGLESSIVSFLVGLGLLAAILIRAPWWQSLALTVGLFCTFAGSGFFILGVGVLVMLAFPARRLLVPYAVPAVAVVSVVLFTPVVEAFVARSSTEFSDDDSSLSLRAIQPYIELWPLWSIDETSALLGRGAGAAQRFVNDLGFGDLLMPSPGRLVFDYGLVAGVILILVFCFFYLDGPSASLAFTMFVSLWTLQPGLSQVVLALPVLTLVTFFAPRRGPRLEENLTITARPARPRRRSALLRWPPVLD